MAVIFFNIVKIKLLRVIFRKIVIDLNPLIFWRPGNVQATVGVRAKGYSLLIMMGLINKLCRLLNNFRLRLTVI